MLFNWYASIKVLPNVAYVVVSSSLPQLLLAQEDFMESSRNIYYEKTSTINYKTNV
jgi:hypothetical protein